MFVFFFKLEKSAFGSFFGGLFFISNLFKVYRHNISGSLRRSFDILFVPLKRKFVFFRI